MLKDERGSVFDLTYIIAVLFAGAIGFYLAYTFLARIIALTPFGTGTDSADILDLGLSAIKMLDYGSIFVVVGLSIVAVLLAFQVRSHPAFFIFTWLCLALVVFISIIFSNVFYQVSQAPELSEAVNQFPYTYLVFSNLPTIALIMSAVIAIVMHSKTHGGVEY